MYGHATLENVPQEQLMGIAYFLSASSCDRSKPSGSNVNVMVPMTTCVAWEKLHFAIDMIA